jgi:hypothetical protein
VRCSPRRARRSSFDSASAAAREGCRRRTTPPSLRFLGRRVYLEAVVLVASVVAAISGAGRGTARATGVPPRTLGRWLGWWRGSFLATAELVALAAALTTRHGGGADDDARVAVAGVAVLRRGGDGRVARAATRAVDDDRHDPVVDSEGRPVTRRLAQRMA